jgi:hypothetical protein
VFFNREWSRVEGDAEKGNIRDIASPCFADGESKKQWDDLFEGPESVRGKKVQRRLKTNRGDHNRRVSEVKELIDTREEDSQSETDDPYT